MPEAKSTASKYQWFADEMVYKRRKGRAKTWTVENPPLPDWAKAAGGAVSTAQFIRIYRTAESQEALKKELFWLSHGQIEAMRSGISAWLEANDVAPLAPLAETAVLGAEDLETLLAEGVLAPIPGSALDLRLNPPPEGEEEELDLTPTPPRPNEDPLQGKTFNEIMHMPEAKNERQMVTMMGMGKGIRFTGKH